MKAAIRNVLRVLLGALTMTALMMAVLFAEAHAAGAAPGLAQPRFSAEALD